MSAEARVLALRTAPPVVLGGRRSVRLLERNLIVYRHTWVIIFSGFFEPIFYLFSIGVGIGELVGDLGGVSYKAFVAPALLASSSMNGAIYESTMNIFHKLRYAKTYDAMLATPLAPGDVAVGEITWCLIRGALYGAGFLVVMTAMGLIHSWWGLAALPAAVLIGFAFAATGMAGTTFVRTWADFDLLPAEHIPGGAADRGPAHAALPGRGDDQVADARNGRAGPGRERGLSVGDGPHGPVGHEPAAGAPAASVEAASCSALCLPIAVMMAAPTSPMNVGRFSAAQSRDDVVDSAEPWKAGNT